MEDKKEITQEAPVRSAKAFVRHVRISPRKARLVIDTIRFQPTQVAFAILANLKKKAAHIVEKLLKSAVANAKVLGLDENRLYVAEVRADGGPSLKRFMSRSMGRADRIMKRTSHFSLIVKEGSKIWKGGFGSQKEASEQAGTTPASAKTKLSSKKKTAALKS